MLLTKGRTWIILITVGVAIISKIYINSLLMAENGDTYDFFRIASNYQRHNYFVDSKRMPLFPLFLSLLPENWFISGGRLFNNIIWIISGFLFAELCRVYFKTSGLLYTLSLILYLTNFVILDNSFFIMSDGLFTAIVLLILTVSKTVGKPWVIALLCTAAFYTRVEGLLIGMSYFLYLLFNKRYRNLFIFSLIVVLLILPYLYRNMVMYNNPLYSGYLSDRAGFTFKPNNILKALASLCFDTGGFWFLPLLLSNLGALISGIKAVTKTFEFYIFILITTLLTMWGFYIRLYSIPIIFSLLTFVNLLNQRDHKIRLNLLFVVASSLFFLYSVLYLNHIELSSTKISKLLSILLSFVVLALIRFYNGLRFKYLAMVVVIILNIVIFTDKFVKTRYKYYTIVEACEFFTHRYSSDRLGYFDDSGVEKWYLKDFEGKRNFLNSDYSFSEWLEKNNISHLLLTYEMGYQDAKVKDLIVKVKKMPTEAVLTSPYEGGKSVIYAIQKW